MALTVPCTKCGHDIDISPEMKALAAGKPIAMQHGEGLCPTDKPEPQRVERRWRCEVKVYEVYPCPEDGEHPSGEHDEDGNERELFASFAADGEATTLQQALPKLADLIGVQWEQAVEHAPFADQPVICAEEGCEEPVERGRATCAEHVLDDAPAASTAPSDGPRDDPAGASPHPAVLLSVDPVE